MNTNFGTLGTLGAVGFFGIAGGAEIWNGVQALRNNEKASALRKFSVAVVSFAAGYALLSSISRVAQCPIDQLGELLSKEGNDSMLNRFFQVFNDTQGITCDNYHSLPPTGWNERQVTSLKDSDLMQSASWSIDAAKRPFIAIKFICEKGWKKGAATIFQPYNQKGDVLVIKSAADFRGTCPCFDFYKHISFAHLNPFKELFTNGTADFRDFLGRISERVSLLKS